MVKVSELKDSLESKVFLAAVAVMKEDPVLSQVVRTWAVLDEDDRAANFMPPATAMMPMIRVRPASRDDHGTTVSTSTSTMAVRIEVFVEGAVARHLLNLWGAVREAWRFARPMRDTSVKCFMDREAGSSIFDVTSPGYGYGQPRNDESALYLSGVGQVEIQFQRPR